MANRSSALESNYPVGINAANNESRLQLSEIKNLQLTQVAAWPDSINKVGSYIANHLNLNEYATPNKAIVNNSVVIYNPVLGDSILNQSESTVKDFIFDKRTKYLITVSRIAEERNIIELINIFNSLSNKKKL